MSLHPARPSRSKQAEPIYPWEGKAVRLRAKLGISVILSGCMAAGAGAGLAAVPAAAAVKPATSRPHVSPFGAGAHRAAARARRHAAAPAVNVNTVTTRWVSNTVPV